MTTLLQFTLDCRAFLDSKLTPPVDGEQPVAAGSLYESTFAATGAAINTPLADAQPTEWKRFFRKGVAPGDYNPDWAQPRLTARGSFKLPHDIVNQYIYTIHELPAGGSCQYEIGFQPVDGEEVRMSCALLFGADGKSGVFFFTRWLTNRNMSAVPAQSGDQVRSVSQLLVMQDGNISSVNGEGGSPVTDQPFFYQNVPATVFFEYDHVTKILRMRGDGGGWSWDLTPYDLQGRGVGFGAGGPYQQTANIDYNKVRFTTSTGRLGVVNQLLRSSNLTFTSSLVYDGAKPTKIQHRTLDVTTRVPFGDWVTGTAVIDGPDNGHGTIEYSGSVPTSRSAIMQYRMFNDTTVEVRAPNTTTFNYVAAPTVFGANVRSNTYYSCPPMLNNWAKYCAENIPGSRLYIPYMGIKGINTLTTNTGTKINHITAVGVNLISTNPTTGVHVLEIVEDQDVANLGQSHRYLDFSAPITSLSVVRQGKTGEFSDEWLAMLSDLGGLRDLDMVGTNLTGGDPEKKRPRNLDNDPIWYQRDFAGALVPFPVVARAIAKLRSRNANFKVFWHTIGIDMDMDDIRAEAIAARDTIPSEVKIVLEYGNELPWNFPGNAEGALFQGMYAGYFDGYPWDAPAPVNLRPKKPMITGTSQQFTNADTSTFPALKAGDAVYANVSGIGDVFYEVLKDAPAGTPIKDTTVYSENVLWNKSRNGRYPARRWLIQRSLQVFKIWKEVFGASFDARCAPVRMGQYGQRFVGSTHQDMELSYLPEYTGMLKGIGHATYLYPAPGTNTGAEDWTVDKLEAAYAGGIPDLINKIRALYNDAEILGIPQVMIYEGMNTHFVGGSLNWANTYRDFWRSPNRRRVIRDLVIAHRKEFPNAVVMQYDLFGDREWSRFMDPNDTASPVLLGYQDGFAAALT